MKIYQKLNDAYKKWSNDPTTAHMEDLVELVRKSVSQRYGRIDRAHKDIAQRTVVRVWRSLTGDLKPHNPKRGDFAKYVAVAAISERKDFHKHDRLVLVSETLLEEMQLDNELNKGFKSYQGTDPVAFETGEK